VKQWVKISYDEWFPYYDIEAIEDTLDVDRDTVVVELDEEDYLIYKGLLLQMEKLQMKLDKLHTNNRKRK
jgi:Cdc6-like AAA superfamily ATPase